MKIFVVNTGSSSLKYQLINMEGEKVISKGIVERIGDEGSIISYTNNGGEKQKIVRPVKNHSEAMKLVFEILSDKEKGVIKSVNEIDAIGHRVVHAGERYNGSVLITEDVVNALEDCSFFAPLHNPANIKGIRACQEALPGVPMVGVFDTAFHQTMPDYAYMYALPYEMYEKYKVRRYGFHGTSHRYVSAVAVEMLGKKNSKIISCHLGNGASVAAILNGALEMFDYMLKKYIGAYITILGGLDAIIFTAGIGENDWETRYEACKNMEFMGLYLDVEKNKNTKGTLAEISLPESKVKVYVIPTNEELMIARDTKCIVEELRK